MKTSLSKLSYTQKNAALIVAFLVFAVASYFITIGDTLALMKDNSVKEEKLAKYNHVTTDLKKINTQLDKADQVVKVVSDLSYRQNLIQYVSETSDKYHVKVREVDRPQLFEMNGLDIEMNRMSFSGSFHDLVELVFEMENSKLNPGKISSIIFEKKTNRVTKRSELNCELYFQIVKSP